MCYIKALYFRDCVYTTYTREGEEGAPARSAGRLRQTDDYKTDDAHGAWHEAHNYKRYSIFPSLSSSLAFFGACAMDSHRNATNRSEEFHVYVYI